MEAIEEFCRGYRDCIYVQREITMRNNVRETEFLSGFLVSLSIFELSFFLFFFLFFSLVRSRSRSKYSPFTAHCFSLPMRDGCWFRVFFWLGFRREVVSGPSGWNFVGPTYCWREWPVNYLRSIMLHNGVVPNIHFK